jgi:hypothetical protein
MPDVSITFTSAELAELLQWIRHGTGPGGPPNRRLYGMIELARKHSQNPAHPPALSETGDVTVWCVVRPDSPGQQAEVQHWTGLQVRPELGTIHEEARRLRLAGPSSPHVR